MGESNISQEKIDETISKFQKEASEQLGFNTEFVIGGSYIGYQSLIVGEADVRHPIGYPISEWRLVDMPGCCGILISTGAKVAIPYTNKGLGRLLNRFRIELARALGYGVLLCTDVITNRYQQAILDENGWEQITTFVNPRTYNIVEMREVQL